MKASSKSIFPRAIGKKLFLVIASVLFLVALFLMMMGTSARDHLDSLKTPMSDPPKKKDEHPLNQILSSAREREVAQKHDIAAADGIDDTVTAVVECRTSAGNLTIDVRSGWSPLGAAQFLRLVDLDLFTDLPFTRVCPKYITQYGRKYRQPNTLDPLREAGVKVIADDPNMWGRRDMDLGYVFFAGSGRDSRFDEMVVALCDMKGCRASGLGKAQWETPVGTIRKEGFAVLSQIEATGRPYPRLEMAGQHPKAAGPNPGKMMQDPDYLKREYPSMAYWRGCRVEQRDTHISRPITVDHPDSVQAHSVAKPKPPKGKSSMRGGSESGAEIGDHGAVDAQPSFRVEFTVATTKNPAGKVVFEIRPDWAPLGAERFKELTQSGFFDDARFFRTIKGFMAQFGIGSTPAKHKEWQKRVIKDDAVKVSNTRGTITFATSGANSRTSQLFINFGDNKFLDNQGFAPIGRVVEGMEHIDALFSGYGEGGKGDGTDGKGPSQGRLVNQGNAYLEKLFPKLSFIISAKLL